MTFARLLEIPSGSVGVLLPFPQHHTPTHGPPTGLTLSFITLGRMHKRNESQDAQWRDQVVSAKHFNCWPFKPEHIFQLARPSTKCEHVYERAIAIGDQRAAQHFTDPCPVTADDDDDDDH